MLEQFPMANEKYKYSESSIVDDKNRKEQKEHTGPSQSLNSCAKNEKQSKSAPLPELTSSSRLTTEVVSQLFGFKVGPVISDHSCSYQRKSGRLYAGKNAVCFYSNLFGFEHRFMIEWTRVQEIRADRTNGICLCAMDSYEKEEQDEKSEDDHHFFRGFKKRDEVLNILLHLHSSAMSKTVGSVSSRTGSHAGQRRNFSNMARFTQGKSLHDSLFGLEEIQSNALLAPKKTQATNYIKHPVTINSQKQHEKKNVPENIDGKSPNKNTSSDFEQLWMKMIECTDPSFKETALNKFQLPCTLKTFFTNFLADDAPYSHEQYHLKNIGDTNLETTAWRKLSTIESESDTTSFLRDLNKVKYKDSIESRQIKFHHKINTPVGKSIARGTKFQTLYSFPNNKGYILDCKIDCVGVHASDCFFVEERWIIEPYSKNNNEQNVMLTTRFEVRFIKTTIWKGVIETMTNAETKKWFDNYGAMLKESIGGSNSDFNTIGGDLEHKSNNLKIEQNSSALDKKKSLLLYNSLGLFCLTLLIGCFIWDFLYMRYQFAITVIPLRKEMVIMNHHLKDLKEELELYKRAIKYCAEGCTAVSSTKG